jgi:hypothetical protein
MAKKPDKSKKPNSGQGEKGKGGDRKKKKKDGKKKKKK